MPSTTLTAPSLCYDISCHIDVLSYSMTIWDVGYAPAGASSGGHTGLDISFHSIFTSPCSHFSIRYAVFAGIFQIPEHFRDLLPMHIVCNMSPESETVV
jgi:hypothetical protein